MGLSRGLATGAQIGNAVISTYRDAKLKSGLANAGKFSPTDVADGEEAHAAGLKAKQARVAQISADDPDFAAKYKQVEDDFAPTMSALETNRGKAKSSMVQLPGGRRIEQDGAFSPEQMAGLRAEQAAKVYSEQGYPEEAAKSTAMAQGIAKNQLDMQKGTQDLAKGALDLKEATRKDKLFEEYHRVDDAYHSLGNPKLSMEERTEKVKFLANRIGSLVTSDEKQFKGTKFKGISDDGSEIHLETSDGTGSVPLTLDMLHKGYAEMVMRRDPQKFAEYQQKVLEHKETQAGLNQRNVDDNKSAEKRVGMQVAGGITEANIRASSMRDRAAGGSGLSQEDNTARRNEIADVMDRTDLTSAQKDDEINRINFKYSPKAGQLKEPTKVGLSIGDLEKIQMMTDIPRKGETPEAGLARRRNHANAIHPGAGDQLYGGGEASPAAAGGPAPGTVRNGFRFKGGSPNDRNSWEAI